MASPKAGDQCQVHRLRFEALTGEFQGDDPDLRELLHGFVAGRCQAQVLDHEGNYARVALCAEDIELTDDSSLFDESGAFVFACPGHATWLQEQAVDDRACSGERCSHGTPSAALFSFRKRIFCGACKGDAEVEFHSTGRTPARPQRSLAWAPSSASSSDSFVGAEEVAAAAASAASVASSSSSIGGVVAAGFKSARKQVFGVTMRAAEHAAGVVAPRSVSPVVDAPMPAPSAPPAPPPYEDVESAAAVEALTSLKQETPAAAEGTSSILTAISQLSDRFSSQLTSLSARIERVEAKGSEAVAPPPPPPSASACVGCGTGAGARGPGEEDPARA